MHSHFCSLTNTKVHIAHIYNCTHTHTHIRNYDHTPTPTHIHRKGLTTLNKTGNLQLRHLLNSGNAALKACALHWVAFMMSIAPVCVCVCVCACVCVCVCVCVCRMRGIKGMHTTLSGSHDIHST